MSTPTHESHSAIVQPQYQTLCAAEERVRLERETGRWDYSLSIAQQPKQSRMCGVGEKNNRRPIDPPPAVKLDIKDRFGRPVTYPAMDTATYFLQVLLVTWDTLQPVVVPAREKQMTAIVGVTNTTLHRINVPTENGGTVDPWGVFAFTDLSVRQEGDYRLQFHLFEIIGGEAVHRARAESDRFHVYAAKGFPGMEQSTAFTDLLKKHGIRVRVSKSIRATKKFTTKVTTDSTFQKFDPEGQQRLLINPNLRNLNYDMDTRDPQFDHRRRGSIKYESAYESGVPMYSNNTLPLPGSLPILPPPHNAGPSPVTPTYSDRSDSHSHNNRMDYNTQHGYFHQSAASPIYPRPSAEHPVSSYEYERRPSDSRPRASYGNYGTNAYSTAPYPPSPYSPQARGYSPASSGSLGSASSYHSQSRHVQSPTYSSRGLRLPSSTYNASVTAQRRLEITQAHLPPITNVYPEPHSHVPAHAQMEEGRNVSRTERPNGSDYIEEQYQPPPPPNSWYLQDNNNGYGNEGYRG